MQEGDFQLTKIAKFTFEAGTRLVEAVEHVEGITAHAFIDFIVSKHNDKGIFSKTGFTRIWLT